MDIGIIGSADGPTSILVAGPGIDLVPFAIAAAVLVTGLVVYVIQRNRKKR